MVLAGLSLNLSHRDHEIQSKRSSVQGSFHSPGNSWDGRAEDGAVDQSALIFDDLVDFVGWSQHSGRLGYREAAAIMAVLLRSRNRWRWKSVLGGFCLLNSQSTLTKALDRR